MTRKIALLQMCSGIDPAANAATLARAAKEAAAAGAVMLFAPEMSAMLDRQRERGSAHIVAEADSTFVAQICEAARRTGIWIHLGSLPVVSEVAGEGWRNRSLVIDGQGVVRARYDKIHLFDVDLPTGERWRESAAYSAGHQSILLDSPAGRLGLTICYDLRFAALFDALGAAGAEIICVPAAFTVPTGEAHWHVLLRARAIEQGCFIIAAAQSGSHEDGRSTYGHSLVVSPWGDVLLDMGTEPGLGFVEIDLQQVSEVRSKIAAIRHRRPIAPVSHVG